MADRQDEEEGSDGRQGGRQEMERREVMADMR
jgi:hypothetical protein